MLEVIMWTAEPASTREATKWVVKLIDITYTKSDLDKVSVAAVQIDKY